MAKITSNEILREQSLEKLTEAYYEQYKHDNRLPELFELIEPEKLYEWLVKQFEDDFSYKEIKELFDYQPDYLQIGEVEYINGIPHFLFDQSSEGLIFKDEEAIRRITEIYPNTHHYVSTIGVKDSDFSFVKGNVTLQISLHSFDEAHRDWLIPFKKKMSIEELGQIRTESNLKTTINLTLVEESDFDADKLRQYFDPQHFFVKLSPINPNEVSDGNNLGKGIIEGVNLV